MQDMRLTKDAYVRIYKKVNAPRGALYIAGTMSAILILTPIAFAFINSILWSLWSSSTEPTEVRVTGDTVRENIESLTYEPGNMVWGFFTFFGIVAIWALIVALAARHFYKNAPGRMRDELIHERAGFQPDVPLTVGANPVHIIAAPKVGHDLPSRQTYAKIFKDTLGLTMVSDKDYMGSGHICDTYSDGSDYCVCVHVPGKAGAAFEPETHPFFFKDRFARDDDKPTQYTAIFLLDQANAAFIEIAETGINMEKTSGSDTSHMRSFLHGELEVFLYNKQQRRS